MDKNTLQYALDMLEIILTEAHHLPVFITVNKKGCHKKVQRVS